MSAKELKDMMANLPDDREMLILVEGKPYLIGISLQHGSIESLESKDVEFFIFSSSTYSALRAL